MTLHGAGNRWAVSPVDEQATPERQDPVERLRQRVKRARVHAPLVNINRQTLARLLFELDWWLDGNAANVSPGSKAWAVARELIGERDDPK